MDLLDQQLEEKNKQRAVRTMNTALRYHAKVLIVFFAIYPHTEVVYFGKILAMLLLVHCYVLSYSDLHKFCAILQTVSGSQQ